MGEGGEIYPALCLTFPNYEHFTLYWGSGGRVGTWGHIKQYPQFWNFGIEVGNLEYLKLIPEKKARIEEYVLSITKVIR